ncbi:MAG: UvrB/UvrC motif-containing protein, partial [cyanobacterium endosymbiont of Rhopalodia inflata]
YNKINGITPQPIITRDSNSILAFLDISRRLKSKQIKIEEVYQKSDKFPVEKIPELIQDLEIKMKESAKQLEFETAAKYRDQIQHLRDKLLGH